MARRSRKEMYPDTQTFHYHNENPKNRLTTDCVIRAISKATGLGYIETLKQMTEFQILTGYDSKSTKGIAKFLQSIGWQMVRQPRKYDETKYTGKEFCELIKKGKVPNFSNIIANIGGHHIVAIINGKVYDTWDSTHGCIGNYWIKYQD